MIKKFFPAVLFILIIALQACSPPTQSSDDAENEVLQEQNSSPTLIEQEDPKPTEPINQVLLQEEDIENLIEPLSVAKNFYEWYFAQSGDEIFNQRSYEEHPALSDIFKSDIGFLLDSFIEQSGYDPFTCSQAILPNLNFDRVVVSGNEAYVLGKFLEDEQVRYYLVLQLGTGDGTWKIGAIHCPFFPATPAIAFYTEYLGYISGGNDLQTGIDDPNNPLSNGFFDDFFLISEDYRSQILNEVDPIDSNEFIGDPILQNQVLPISFWVEPWQDGEEIVARLTFGPQSARYYRLHLKESPTFTWLVDSIEKQEFPIFDPSANLELNTDNWQDFINQDYIFNFKYPQEWSFQESDLAGIPPEDPMKEMLFFYPPWAEENRPAFWITVLEGSEDQMIDYYVTESHQRVTINNMTVSVDRDQFETRFIFQHPALEKIWIVIGDPSPGIVDFERYAEEMNIILAPLLRTMDFSLD
jgi:hypothetical protein